MIVPSQWRPDALVALVWLGFVMVAGQTLVMASVRRVRAETSAAFLLLNPITAALLGVTVLGEGLAVTQAVGGLLVLLGMADGVGSPCHRLATCERYRSGPAFGPGRGERGTYGEPNLNDSALALSRCRCDDSAGTSRGC